MRLVDEKFSSGPDLPGPVGHQPGTIHIEVPPLDVDGVRTTQVGTALWALALLALLPFWSLLAEAGRLWWIWTCTAGLGMGLIGIEYTRRRRDRPHTATQDTPRTAPTKRPPRGGRRRA